MTHSVVFRITRNGLVEEEGFDTIFTENVEKSLVEFIKDLDLQYGDELHLEVNPLLITIKNG